MYEVWFVPYFSKKTSAKTSHQALYIVYDSAQVITDNNYTAR